MDHSLPSLVSTAWLADHLADEKVAVLDASKHLPAAKRDPRAEYGAAHIPGARFLDLAGLKDAGSTVPDALPTHSQLLARLAQLGVSADDTLVLYDDSAVRSSARAWFTLKVHGVRNVAILDGGLDRWREEGRALESGDPKAAHEGESAATNTAPDRVRTKADMLANIDSQAEQVIDARAADRVYGDGVDPVHGGPNGRIPGALNLPFTAVFTPQGTYKSPADLRAAFEAAGIDWSRPVTASCGSGLTASVLLFAMHLAGKDDTALYDGSWAEWSADPETPKAHGPE